MVEIDYKSLDAPLEQAVADHPLQACLIFGEEVLVKEAFGAVLGHLLPEAAQSLNFEPYDGSVVDVAEVVERVNTYSLMPGTKVVALTDARLFLSARDRTGLVKKAAAAVEGDDFKSGARHLLSAMAAAGLDFDDFAGPDRVHALKPLGVDEQEAGWLDRLIDYCRERRLEIPKNLDEDAVLLAALEKGFPAGNHLVVTVEQVDRRRSLYAAFKAKGTVIDCSVPRGERHADRQVQNAVMRRQMASVLERSGKRIEPAAADRLMELVGFDLRTVAANLEKLVDFTGDRRTIGEDDVRQVLRRTKKDPIFEFTNALTERDLDGALFYLDALLVGGVLAHPLQLLGAAANQLRKLILLKEFAESPEGRAWQPQMNFSVFKNRILPALQAQDRRLLERIDAWQQKTAKEDAAQTETKASRKAGKAGEKGGAKTDLRMVPNPNNAYPVFQLLKKSGRFSREELTAGLQEVARCDLLIKTGGGDPRLILEKAVIAICVPSSRRSGSAF
jgi:DNA polymerase-3 subunit delta